MAGEIGSWGDGSGNEGGRHAPGSTFAEQTAQAQLPEPIFSPDTIDYARDRRVAPVEVPAQAPERGWLSSAQQFVMDRLSARLGSRTPVEAQVAQTPELVTPKNLNELVSSFMRVDAVDPSQFIELFEKNAFARMESFVSSDETQKVRSLIQEFLQAPFAPQARELLQSVRSLQTGGNTPESQDSTELYVAAGSMVEQFRKLLQKASAERSVSFDRLQSDFTAKFSSPEVFTRFKTMVAAEIRSQRFESASILEPAQLKSLADSLIHEVMKKVDPAGINSIIEDFFTEEVASQQFVQGLIVDRVYDQVLRVRP